MENLQYLGICWKSAIN